MHEVYIRQVADAGERDVGSGRTLPASEVRSRLAERPLGPGKPAFERYIGIDYSGAETPTSSLKGLRVFIAEGSSPPGAVPPPPSPRKNWSRREIAEWLIGELSKPRRAIVGIDHAFSFPLRYFESHALPPDWHCFSTISALTGRRTGSTCMSNSFVTGCTAMGLPVPENARGIARQKEDRVRRNRCSTLTYKDKLRSPHIRDFPGCVEFATKSVAKSISGRSKDGMCPPIGQRSLKCIRGFGTAKSSRAP